MRSTVCSEALELYCQHSLATSAYKSSRSNGQSFDINPFSLPSARLSFIPQEDQAHTSTPRSRSLTSTTIATPKPASLLVLPRELRDQIYDHLLMEKLNITFHKRGGMFKRATFTPSKSTLFGLHWVDPALHARPPTTSSASTSRTATRAPLAVPQIFKPT